MNPQRFATRLGIWILLTNALVIVLYLLYGLLVDDDPLHLMPRN